MEKNAFNKFTQKKIARYFIFPAFIALYWFFAGWLLILLNEQRLLEIQNENLDTIFSLFIILVFAMPPAYLYFYALSPEERATLLAAKKIGKFLLYACIFIFSIIILLFIVTKGWDILSNMKETSIIIILLFIIIFQLTTIKKK
ncbi:hypothetical protein HY932_02365 [Candidatus Falkowbacteria bacterium]|nr:hypothetical protein [Candidatus Falkowbacteria bacterium]